MNPPSNEPLIPDSLGHRLIEDVRTCYSELTQAQGRWQRAGALTVGLATQAVDRGRAMVLALPWAFDNTLKYAAEHELNHWQTAGVAGVAVGGTFAAWGWVVGSTMHAAINSYPRTTETVARNHPDMVNVVTKAVGGFAADEPTEKSSSLGVEIEAGPYDKASGRLSKVRIGLARALKSAFLYGTTAYVGVAKVKGYSNNSVKKLKNTVAVESGLVFAGLAGGVSEAVSHNAFGLAQDIRDTLTNKPILFSAQGVFIAAAVLDNWRQRKREHQERLILQQEP